MPITLDVNELEFPNGKVEPNWYDGHTTIQVLNIYMKNVTTIEPNAFSTHAFHRMRGLVINAVGFVEIKDGAFNGLDAMEHLSLWADVAYAYTYTGNCLVQFAQRTLGIMVLGNFDWNSNNIFCNAKMSRLLQIELHLDVKRDVGQLRAISHKNFSSLTVIEKLDMRGCFIDVIMDGTFDYIGETLGDLNLSNNQIKHMNIDMFRVFFDSTTRTKYYSKILRISNNPIECVCDRYLLMNMTLITFGYTPKQMRHLLCRSKYGSCDVEGNNFCDECEHPQMIHLNGKPFVNAFTDTYSYPNYQLKFHRSGSMLLVTQHRPRRPYRLWIHNLNDPGNRRRLKCPNRGWIYQSIDCLLLSNSSERVLIERYLREAELILVCVIFWTHEKRSWPLHCQTLHKSLVVHVERSCFWSDVLSCVWPVLGLTILAFGLGFASSIAIGCWETYDSRIKRQRLNSYCYYSCDFGSNVKRIDSAFQIETAVEHQRSIEYMDIDDELCKCDGGDNVNEYIDVLE